MTLTTPDDRDSTNAWTTVGRNVCVFCSQEHGSVACGATFRTAYSVSGVESGPFTFMPDADLIEELLRRGYNVSINKAGMRFEMVKEST